MALTEKMKSFCREYMKNGGNGTQAYKSAYNWNGSNNGAEVEARALLKREDINLYLKSLAIPLENKAISEREKKRAVLWDIINAPDATYNDRCRALDILNKMDSDYINITKDITEHNEPINNLDTDTLKLIAGGSA